jgi:hypothetical protein
VILNNVETVVIGEKSVAQCYEIYREEAMKHNVLKRGKIPRPN